MVFRKSRRFNGLMGTSLFGPQAQPLAEMVARSNADCRTASEVRRRGHLARSRKPNRQFDEPLFHKIFSLDTTTVRANLPLVDTYLQAGLDALADATRMAIFQKLSGGPIAVNELARTLPVTPSGGFAASQGARRMRAS